MVVQPEVNKPSASRSSPGQLSASPTTSRIESECARAAYRVTRIHAAWRLRASNAAVKNSFQFQNLEPTLKYFVVLVLLLKREK